MDKMKLQALPPKQAHFCLEVLHFLEDIDFDLQNKKILLAFSGGLDSSAVLLFFSLIKEKFNLELFAVHINHCLREESSEEALHVKTICEDFDIPLIVYKEDIKKIAKEQKKGIEETARDVRYAIFKKELAEKNFDYIALGHHLNDLAEDVLMRQIRGSSLEQSIGMKAIDNERKILRPFLLFEKKLLENLATACKLSWVEDNSNLSDEYLRNRVRLEILPLFLKENPSYLKHVKSNWLQGQSEIFYWQEKLKPFLEGLDLHEKTQALEKKKKFLLERKALQNAEKTVRLKVFARVLRAFKAQNNSQVLFRLDALVMKNESNKHMDINNQLKVKISKEYIEFSVEDTI